ncbi:AraC family transcriptional regulator [Clostridium sp. 19966]|uniref:helix-turn-helix transcriptional regulator n=1 Tax=Clostridium sp. 19966 TaxID=2768166 RepID=UPI0028EDD7D7|nr:AraC family transcriptional regulator [Clostridium sp. 19966]
MENLYMSMKMNFFFVNSEDLHETDAADNNRVCAITILLSYDLLKKYCKDADNYYFDFTESEQAQKKVKNLILECAKVYEGQSEFYELEISIILRKICSVLLKECKKKRKDSNLNSYAQKNIINTKKAIAYMENNYADEISLKSIAGEMGMAPTYFSRFIKKATNETFYSYLTKIRLYHAYTELINSDASITEIALNNGFLNVKSFIEAFKRVYKLTPEKYRKYHKSLGNDLSDS